MLKLNKKGFTLIELLVVIAIIGILATVVMVSLSSAKKKAYRASALATVSGLGTEFILCEDDAGTIMVPSSSTAGGGVICNATGHSTEWPNLTNSGFTYVGITEVLASTVKVFTLTKDGYEAITCNWDGSSNYICS